uniref:PX domain-containing protein n=1 Tax=Esox lucius TaxID=8010 RepID=A0A6Q2XI87_ESOLU
MDTAAFSEDVDKKVFIVGSELVENYTVYIIEVTVGNHKWTIKHRYSDFHDLHERLTAEKKIDKPLLPPKKIIGKNSKSIVEKRQKELEVYLQTLLVTFPVAAPKVLSCFLHFHQYEISGITAALAEELFHKGEVLLLAGEVFTLRPLQLYAITQQLKLAKPTCSSGDAKADMGHILDFTCRLKYLKISGTRGVVGTSNIQEDGLTFDLSIFKALLQIEINDCNSSQIIGLPTLKPCLATLNVHRSVSSMMDLLVPEASEFPLWVAEGVSTDCPVTTVIPTWKTLTTLDMSHNHIRCIDHSVKLIPEVEFLDLSYNQLSVVDHLQHLYNLVHLDLSYNRLTGLEGVHTRLGNIKTLNLAGNQMDSLAGLSKLYSLVNLDLSSNRLGQLEEVRYIGPLPCLERLSLADNPLCIVPDYRTKVLAQFWDRASEVCLDSSAPTEKELDTVEVLKAIQKAKEAKGRMSNNNDKKVVSVRPPEGPLVDPTGRPPLQALSLLPLPLSSPLPPPLPQPPPQLAPAKVIMYVPACWVGPAPLSISLSPPLFLLFLLAGEEEEEETEGEGCPASLSDQGEFEVQGEHGAPEEEVVVTRVVWCLCLKVGDVVEQRSVCLVLTEGLLALFHAPDPSSAAQLHNPSPLSAPCGQPHGLPHLVDVLEADFVIPRDQIASVILDIPDACLSLRVRSSNVVWFLFSDSESLMAAHSSLCSLAQLPSSTCLSGEPSTSQQLLKLLLTSWEFEENQDCVKGGYVAHLVETALFAPPTSTLSTATNQTSTLSTATNQTSTLSTLHVYVLKVDFPALARDQTENSSLRLRSFARLSRLPLASVLLHPRLSDLSGDAHVLELLLGQERVTVLFPLPHDRLRFQRQFSSLRSSLRDIKTVAFLQGGKEYKHSDSDSPQAINIYPSSLSRSKRTDRLQVNSPGGTRRPRPSLSLSYPTKCLLEKLTEDNQVPPHLTLSLSPAQSLLSGLRGQDLLGFFHTNIAEVEKEELQHILWSSVVFYKSPDIEVTSCIMLSTKALYFLLDNSASTLIDQSPLWNGNRCDSQYQPDPELLMSYCFTMKLNHLHSINVGLFDQYFRVVGPSAENILCCLTRDSYGTHRFLQQLMTVLSLQEKLPSPEPSDQDFYTQFGNKSSGKMKNYEMVHSSRVKFIYPSEEEIGDLTFIVAERKGPSGSSSCNILLYVLVFQVQTHQPRLHPQSLPATLVLTSTDVFLLDEDYISYPLPDFAKEPPPRDKYQLTDARRIRDLDRVLMGYQTYPQALTLVFDDVPGPDLLCHLTMDHFGDQEVAGRGGRAGVSGGAESEVQWCVYVPGADSRERLICLLARQWEGLCSRELPVELTG